MLKTFLQRLLTFVVGAVLLFFGNGSVFSQENQENSENQEHHVSSEQESQESEPDEPAEPKESPQPVQETKPKDLRERTLYVPYEKLHKNFEKNGRGVFLPYEEFQQLWKAARAAEKKSEPTPSVSPVPYMITETMNEANVVGEIIQVESTVQINILQDGWKEIPLRLNNVALTKATINGESARIRGNKETGYSLLVEGKKDEKIELLLNYAKSIEKSPGRNSVSFDVPTAPMSRWKVHVPESGVKIDFSPMIAATEISSPEPKPKPTPTPPPPALLPTAPEKDGSSNVSENEINEKNDEIKNTIDAVIEKLIANEGTNENIANEETNTNKETIANKQENENENVIKNEIKNKDELQTACDPAIPPKPMLQSATKPQEIESEAEFSLAQSPYAEQPEHLKASETVLLAFAGGTPTVQIAWTPKSEGATGLEALTSVQLEEKVQIEEGIVRTEARLDYTISRSQIERLAIAISKDQKVVEVFDANIRQWTVKTEDDSQIIHVELFEPAKSKQQIIVKLEQFIENESNTPKDEKENAENKADSRNKTDLSVPSIRAVDVGRQQGILVVRSTEGLSVDVQKSLGLMQMDATELPPNIQQQKWDYAYRISTLNYELALSTEKILPRITTLTRTVLKINASQGNMHFDVENLYIIERAGVFQLFCDIPDGFEVSYIKGYTCPGSVQPAQVDSHHLSSEKDANGMRRLTVNLSKKAIGLTGLQLILIKSFNEPDLQSSFGKAVEFKIQPPTVPQDSARFRDGIMLIQANNALRITPTNLLGIQSLPVEQLQSRWGGATLPNALQSAALGFVYGQEHSSLDLKVERRQPQINAQQMLRVRIENGVVKYTDRFNYDIQFSGVKNLRIDIPEKIADKIRNSNPQVIRESKMVPQPDDLAGDLKEGLVAFSFESGGELLGNINFEISWEEELKQLEVGKKVPISVPQLIPRNVDRSFGHIVISKAASIDLREENSSGGLRSVDPQHEIPAKDRTSDTVAAFEFFDQWNLELSAVRYQNEELKKTSLEEGFLQIVSVRSSENLTARALYRIRSVKQRLGLALPENAIVNDVRINGKIVALESNGQSENKEYLIPLNSVVPDTAFLLELRYSYPGSIQRIEIPRFPGESLYESSSVKESPPMGESSDTESSEEAANNEGPAIQNMRIAVYIPENDVLTHFEGPWTPHFHFDYVYPSTQVENESEPPSLIEQVCAGVHDGGTPATFPVAGSVYVFSALQPGTTPSDTLQLFSAWERGVRASVFSAIILVGIVLCPFTWRWRFTLLILFIIACCVAGIFLPTLTMYVSEQGVFEQAVFWVVLLWCVVSLFRFARTARKNFQTQLNPETKTSEPVQLNENVKENENQNKKESKNQNAPGSESQPQLQPNVNRKEGGNES